MTDGDGMISAASALGMAQAAQERAMQEEVPRIIKDIMGAISKQASQGLTGLRYKFHVSSGLPGLDAGMLAANVLKNLKEQGYYARLVGVNVIDVSWSPPSEPTPL